MDVPLHRFKCLTGKRLTDVCLGYRTLAEYEQNNGYLGAVVGRHGNRIEKGIFTLGGTEYHLAVNDGPNHLHGTFAKKVYKGSIVDAAWCCGQ